MLTLALGIGANTAMFSFADATALRPPDVPRPSEIVRVFTSSKDTPLGEVSYPDYLDFATGDETLTGLVAYETGDFALATSPREPAKYLGGWIVSANFFSVLGVEPVVGRGFLPQEDAVASTVAVISHRLWNARFPAERRTLSVAGFSSPEPRSRLSESRRNASRERSSTSTRTSSFHSRRCEVCIRLCQPMR